MNDPSTNHDQRSVRGPTDLARDVMEGDVVVSRQETRSFVADISKDHSETTRAAEQPTITQLPSSRSDRRQNSGQPSQEEVAHVPSSVSRWEKSDDDSQRFGRFKLLERLGRGGTGEVYRAVHTRLRKEVALELLPADRANDADARDRFAHKVRVMSGLGHPNLVRLETAGEHEGVRYLVMEYVRGIDLQSLLERSDPIPAADACQLIGQAALGLAHMHEQGLVHRNLQPSNLMVTAEGTVKILDLGSAEQANDARDPRLMRRAHSGGEDHDLPAGRWDDIDCLGGTLFALLAGHPPFQTAAESEATHSKPSSVFSRYQPLPGITNTRDDLPTGLPEVVSRMTAREPMRRLKTPLEVVAALAPLAVGCDILELLRRADVEFTGTTHDRENSIDTAEYLTVQSQRMLEPQRLLPFSFTRRHWHSLILAASLMLAAVLGIAVWRSVDHKPGLAAHNSGIADSFSDQLDSSASSGLAHASLSTESSSHSNETPKTNPRNATGSGGEPWSDVAADPTTADHLQQPLRHDLLAPVETERDAFELGLQRHEDGYVLTNLSGRGILQLPIIVPKRYELQWTVERLEGSGSFGIGFPGAGGKLLAIFDHQHQAQVQSGFMHVNRAGLREVKDPHSEPLLPAGQSVRFRLVSNPSGAELLVRRNRRPSLASDSDAESTHPELDRWDKSGSTVTEARGVDTQWSSIVKWQASEALSPPRLGMFDGYYPGVLFLHVFDGSFQVSGMTMPNSDEPPEPQPFLGPDTTLERRIAERIVWRGGHVEVLTENGTRTVHQFYDLTKEPWIRGVTKCGGTPRLAIGNETVRRLGEIDDLVTLDLSKSDVTDAGLGFLNGLTRLRELSLPPGLLGGDATWQLNNLPALRKLNLINSQMDDESLSLLQDFPELTSLCLSGTGVTDGGLPKISMFLPALQHLCLNGCPIDGRELHQLKSLRHLKDLELADTNVSDDDLPVLVDLPSLTTLHLNDTQVTPAGREKFQKQRPDVKVR